MARPQTGRWLPLGRAASALGVDEATLRHWADTGRVRTFRTPGGHRRFREDDLRALMRPEVPRVDDLGDLVERRTAKLLARSPARALQARPWFAAFDERLRARAREHGREFFGDVVRFVATPPARAAIRARLVERERAYGLELRQAGVGPADAAEAFGFFRHLVLEMVTEPRGRGGMLDETQVRTLLNVSDLLDAVLHALLRAWDHRAPARGARISPGPAGAVT
jgi:excisionase family DNA binding protein